MEEDVIMEEDDDDSTVGNNWYSLGYLDFSEHEEGRVVNTLWYQLALICELVVVVGSNGIGIDPLTMCPAWAEINFRMGKSWLEQVVKRPAKPCSKASYWSVGHKEYIIAWMVF